MTIPELTDEGVLMNSLGRGSVCPLGGMGNGIRMIGTEKESGVYPFELWGPSEFSIDCSM